MFLKAMSFAPSSPLSVLFAATRRSAARLLASALAALVAGPLIAADYSDPTWPCIQRKVENMSVGLMWPKPIDETSKPDDPETLSDIAELSAVLSLRRVAIEDLQPQIDAFAQKYHGDEALLGHVFNTTFNTLTKRRSRIISGIGDFSLGQIALAEQIDANRVEMDRLMSEEKPDFDKVDALEERIDWDQIIHSDRQRNIQYLCETPVLLERRLYAIAQMLQFVAD